MDTIPATRQIDPSKFCQHDPDQIDCRFKNQSLVRYKIEPNTKFQDITYLAKLKGTGFFPQGDLSCIKGKAKSGKSFAILFIIIALLKGVYGLIQAGIDRLRVLVFDTEMTAYSGQNRLLKIYSALGWDKDAHRPELVYYSTRDADYKTRRTLLESALIEHTPDIVFLDGARDLILDFNSLAESAETVSFLMQLTKQYNVNIVCVLHQNKADDNMRGHFGHECLNKASDVFSVTKKGVTFIVEQTDSRNAPVSDWSFTLDEQGIPIPTEPERTFSRSDTKEMLLRNEFNQLFEKSESYRYSDLVKSIQVQELVRERTAKERIKLARDFDIIFTDENGLIKFKNECDNSVQG